MRDAMSFAKIDTSYHGGETQIEFNNRMAVLEAKLTTLLTIAGCRETERIARYLTARAADCLSERIYANVEIGLRMPIAYSPKEEGREKMEVYVKVGKNTPFGHTWS